MTEERKKEIIIDQLDKALNEVRKLTVEQGELAYDYIFEAKRVVKDLTISRVSGQRELLKAFQDYYQDDRFDDERTFEWNINKFLEAFNSH